MPRALSQQEVDSFRESVCQVATRRFAEDGVAGVTLRGLASELGCSPMTPYRYFANKDEIFEAVREAAFVRFSECQDAEMRQHADPVARLQAMGRAYLRFAQEEPHAYRIMFQLDQHGEATEEPVPADSALNRGWLSLLETVQDCIDCGAIEGDALTLAHLCWVTHHGAVTLHLAGKLKLGRTLEELVEPIYEHFLRGSTARPIAEEMNPCPSPEALD